MNAAAPETLIGLVRPFEPLFVLGRAQLDAGLQDLHRRYPHLVYDPAAIAALETALRRDVYSIVTRAMVLELNVARLQGTLSAGTAEARFVEFVHRLEQPGVRAAFIADYPLLFQQVALRIEQWAASNLELLERLGEDAALLREALFSGNDPGPLISIEPGEGDRHCDGRTVTITRFETGAAVVYKPHSLSADRHFYDLLQWLNTRGAQPAFKHLIVIDRGMYGWEEHVSQSACESRNQVERFYERCGANLAVLYTFAATDFHFENVIAVGEYPVLIDLEALFHPLTGATPTGATDIAARQIATSVLGVGLLPHRTGYGRDSAGIDFSGIGAEPGQLSPHDVMLLKQLGTDRMAFEPTRVPVGGRNHRPSLEGVDIESAAYAQFIARGFLQTYRLLCNCRDELVAPGGWVDTFADDEVRVIVRPTQTYGTMLQTSFHPDLLHDARDRDKYFDKLRSLPHAANFDCIVDDECEDLRRGDIPRFTTSPGTRFLRTSSGRQIEDVLPDAGRETVKRRIAQLGDDDLARQLWYVRSSLGAPARHELPDTPHLAFPRPINRQSPLAVAAATIGDRLERLAIHGVTGATWIGASVAGQRGVNIEPLGPDLYDGLPGVALFLAYLGAIAGEARYENLARRALVTMREELVRDNVTAIGALSGWGGVVYALALLGELWDDQELFAEAIGYADRAAGFIESDCMFDIVGGAAGCIVALLALNARSPATSLLSIAQRCGEHLLANFIPCARGGGWISAGTSNVPLTGFSHGSAGIALSLLRLNAATADDRFRTAAQAAIAYERSVFSPNTQNWPDFRTRSEPATQTASGIPQAILWCHGAPGIGLARLGCREFLDDPEIEAEIDVALRTTANEGFRGGHSLCHGNLGNLELLHVAARRRGSPALHTQVSQLCAALLDDAAANGWRCGNPAAVETPGLMTGIAGIGYQLLRLSEPDRVPPVLLFEPPDRRGSATNSLQSVETERREFRRYGPA
jgi:type 2 lantibiotic biosynthesis protein LanM